MKEHRGVHFLKLIVGRCVDVALNIRVITFSDNLGGTTSSYSSLSRMDNSFFIKKGRII